MCFKDYIMCLTDRKEVRTAKMTEKQKQVLEKLGKVIEKMNDKGLEKLLSIGDGIAIGMEIAKEQEKKAG